MSIQPSQPQSIGGVLDTTFQLYKASLLKMIPLSLLLVIAGCLQYIYIFTRGANPADPLAMLNLMTSWGYWLSLLAGMIGSTWIIGCHVSQGRLDRHRWGPRDRRGVAGVAAASARMVVMLILFRLAVAIGTYC